MQDAYIVAGLRTAVTKAKRGGFRFTRPDDLAIDVIQQLMASIPQLEKTRVDDVMVGNAVPEAEQGLQVGRIIAARALGHQAPGITVNRYCASGLETIAMATAKTSDEPDYYLNMGLTAEAVAKAYDVSRAAQDAFSLSSHQKALHAIQQGHFKNGIVPITVKEVYLDENGKKQERSFVVDTDEGVRADTSLESLSSLKPAFAVNGSVTAGNSSQNSDGAAFVVVMGEAMVKELGLQPLGRLVHCAVAGVHQKLMGIGPVEAIPKLLKGVNMRLEDIDLIELNEAFASQAIAVINTLGLDADKLNINGGAIALGHPLGCMGAKLSVQILGDLKRLNKKYGMVSACVGGGQGIAGLIERF